MLERNKRYLHFCKHSLSLCKAWKKLNFGHFIFENWSGEPVDFFKPQPKSFKSNAEVTN